jgi:hypothetical protein
MTDRNEELNQLAEEAGLMVESLSELKERINSFHNAETQISSVSDSLIELIQTTSGQVEKASQILEMSAKVGIPELLEWIEPIFNDTKQVVTTLTTLEGRIRQTQGLITNGLTTSEENITATQGLAQTTLEGRISESQELITNALTTSEENITATQGLAQTTLEGRISESQEFITNALTTLGENITVTQGLISNAQAEYKADKTEYKADKAKYMSANRTHTIMLSLALLLGVAGIVLNFIQ